MNQTGKDSATPTLGQIICSGWKKLALADQTDADEVVKILQETLEQLEAVEGM